MNPRLSFAILIATACLFGFSLFYWNGALTIPPLSDGGSHLVTGFLAYDWIHSGQLRDPMGFATNYFRHFPYIGLLLWPPLFYVLELVAFSLFGATAKVGLLLATVILVAGATVFGYAIRQSGRSLSIAVCAIIVLLTSTLVEDVQRALLIDGLVSALSFAATIQFAKYIHAPSWRAAIGVAALAILAFYAKGNAIQLALVFPLVALLMRRPRALFTRMTIFIAATCLLITGPWLYVTAKLSAQGAQYTPSLKAALEITAQNLTTLFQAVPFLAVFALVGTFKVGHTLQQFRKSAQAPIPFDAACLALALGSLGFHALVAVAPDSRYMMSALYGVIGVAVLGLETTATYVCRRVLTISRPRLQARLVLLVLLVQAATAFLTPLENEPHGADGAAALVIKSFPQSNRSVLLSGDHNTETSVGPAIAQLEGSRRGAAESAVVVRGSRLFAGGGYRNRDYEAKFASDDAYKSELVRLGIPVIVTGTARPNEQWGHIAAIQRILDSGQTNYVKQGVVPFFKDQVLQVWVLKPEFTKPMDFDTVSASNALRERMNKVVK